jgi:arylsulfatase A-like enzyme
VVQGYRDARGKGSVYEGGLGVPLIVSGGGLARRGDRESALVASVDLYATIAELAGAGTREVNDSKSFAQLLVQPGTGLREFTYAEFSDAKRDDWAIRNNRFKLVSRSNAGTELYDLKNDPLEENNLIRPRVKLSGLAEVAGHMEELQAAARLIRQ